MTRASSRATGLVNHEEGHRIGHAYEYQTPKGLRIGYIKKVLANGCYLIKPLLRRAELPKVRGLLTGHPCSRWRASR